MKTQLNYLRSLRNNLSKQISSLEEQLSVLQNEMEDLIACINKEIVISKKYNTDIPIGDLGDITIVLSDLDTIIYEKDTTIHVPISCAKAFVDPRYNKVSLVGSSYPSCGIQGIVKISDTEKDWVLHDGGSISKATFLGWYKN